MANNPMTRKEIYLAKMAGEDVSVPEPMTREETYLKKIAENGGSGGGGQEGSGNLIITFDDDTGVCDTKWSDIRNALADGKIVIYIYIETQSGTTIAMQSIIGAVTHMSSKYQIYIGDDTSTIFAECATEDGYPVMEG